MTEILSIQEVRRKGHVVTYLCDNCSAKAKERRSHFDRKNRHFCGRRCYSEFRAAKLPKEEQHRFGTGVTQEEKNKRIKCRSQTNHAIRDGKLTRSPCEVCGDEKSEAHHDDYDKPLDVRWLCFKHHRQWHKETPELLEVEG